jgi:tRNA A-37 threonylcarbamoyl transferase component Bud32
VAAVLKWSRPVTALDRIARWARGGKGPREGKVLLALRERGVPVPPVLAWSDEGTDVLLLAEVAGLRPLPSPAEAPRALVEAVARTIARAHEAGLVHRDLHRGNVLLAPSGPMLVDLGGARLEGEGLDDRSRLRELARALHGLLGDASRSVRHRALRAYLVESDGDAARARHLAPAVESRARETARRYRRGRDRRPTRDGLHYETFRPAGRGQGVRRRETTPESWRDEAAALLAAAPPGAVEAKAGGRVLRAHLPGRDGDVAIKRYAPVVAGRLPRPIRAFRVAVALRERGVAAPEPLVAATGPDGAGVLVSAWVDAPNLLAFAGGGRGGALARLAPRDRRRMLEALGRSLRAMHDAEVSHRDLKAPNLLVLREGSRFSFPVSDLEGARVRRGEVSWRRRARDLARLDASLEAHATDRLRTLDAYLRVPPRPPVSLRAFAARIVRRAAARR